MTRTILLVAAGVFSGAAAASIVAQGAAPPDGPSEAWSYARYIALEKAQIFRWKAGGRPLVQAESKEELWKALGMERAGEDGFDEIDALTWLGANGWELAAYAERDRETRYVFKRRR